MKRALAVVGLLFLLSTGSASADNGQQTTTLLTPSGQPVGGQWQQWMNASYMPTYNGPMVLARDKNETQSREDCGPSQNGTTEGCTNSEAFTDVVATEATMPETVLTRWLVWEDWPDQQRWVLLYEQAHVIDMRYLTDADREQLLQLWGVPLPPAGMSVETYWWQGENELNNGAKGGDDVYGEWFSTDYAICAIYHGWTMRKLNHMDPSNMEPNLDYPGIRAFFDYPNSHTLGRADLLAQNESCGMISAWVTAAS